MSVLNKACLIMTALTILFTGRFGQKNRAIPNVSPKVEVLILNVERNDRETTSVQWEIVNHRDHPILFPKAKMGSGIYTVEIEQHGKTGWTALPKDREWMHSDSDPIKMGPGETYKYNWNLSNDYMLPLWATFPKPRHPVALDKELRLNVTYFEEQGDWEAYLAELSADKVYWGRMEPLLRKWGQQAFSTPFKLPPATRADQNASPTRK
jgi:hypothetical protein